MNSRGITSDNISECSEIIKEIKNWALSHTNVCLEQGKALSNDVQLAESSWSQAEQSLREGMDLLNLLATTINSPRLGPHLRVAKPALAIPLSGSHFENRKVKVNGGFKNASLLGPLKDREIKALYPSRTYVKKDKT